MNTAHSKPKRPRHPMPDFVRLALQARGLMSDYLARPAYQCNDHPGWIERARRLDTQARRLARMLDELEVGGVYMNMRHAASRKT